MEMREHRYKLMPSSEEVEPLAFDSQATHQLLFEHEEIFSIEKIVRTLPAAFRTLMYAM
jgi:hypothetical protein